MVVHIAEEIVSFYTEKMYLYYLRFKGSFYKQVARDSWIGKPSTTVTLNDIVNLRTWAHSGRSSLVLILLCFQKNEKKRVSIKWHLLETWKNKFLFLRQRAGSGQCAPLFPSGLPTRGPCSPPPCAILGLGKLIAAALRSAQSLLEAHGEPVVSVCPCFYTKVRAWRLWNTATVSQITVSVKPTSVLWVLFRVRCFQLGTTIKLFVLLEFFSFTILYLLWVAIDILCVCLVLRWPPHDSYNSNV